MLSNISDENLAILYRECLFSVYPSFYEGWGLPVTEALCYGKPVLVSQSSSLPEAGGDFVDYFNLKDNTSLVEGIERLMFDSSYRQKREELIRIGFRARSWKSVAEDFRSAVTEWSARSPSGWKGIPLIELGRYYSFARNNEVSIFHGVQSCEIFRSGTSWWDANEWGCWLKPGPAEIAFALPSTIMETYRVYVGLRGFDGTEPLFDMTILPSKKIMGTLSQRRTKWVTLEFESSDTGAEVHIILEGFARHQERQRSDLDEIVVSIAVIGLFVCAASDMQSRMRFTEAVGLDDVASLARYKPKNAFPQAKVR